MHRPTVAEIDLDALRFNYGQLQNKVEKHKKILAVVKADAYGHGAAFISKELEALGVDQLGVAICEEGVALRKAGIKVPIIILNSVYKGQFKEVLQYSLSPVIFDSNTARKVSDEAKKFNKKVKVHVKIDTGMGRVGILPEDLGPFFHTLKELQNVEIEGLLTHLSTAFGSSLKDKEYTSLQLRRFEEAIKEISNLECFPPLRHVANSAAIIDSLPSSCNLVRPGLMLYGLYPSSGLSEKLFLKPVMTLKTEVIQLKKVPSNFSVSYGRTFITQRDSIIATLPIGYADGYNRLLSNRGEVLIGGEKAPLVGLVCMDMIMVDVTDIPNVQVGDEAVLIGKQGNRMSSADDIANKIGTISYEVLCTVGKRVPRIYKKSGKIVGRQLHV